MYGGDRGHKDLALAEFQAKLLAGQQAYDDPAEARMKWFKWVVSVWAIVAVIVAGAALWLSNALLSAVVVAVATVIAVAVRVKLLRRDRTPEPRLPDRS